MDSAAALRDTILDNLRSRKWRAGHRLPTERELSGTYGLSGAGEVYGGLSVGFSKTLPSDFFDYRNAGEALLENAFVGLRGKTGEGLGCDVSVGRQSFSWRRRTILETRAHQSGIAKPKARQATTATAISEIAVFLLRPSADQ